MKLGDIGLSARITFWAMVLVVAGGVLWVNRDLENDKEAYLSERSTELKMDLHIEQVHLTEAVVSLRQDALFLASLPPVSGMVRAGTNSGIDPRDKSSYAQWESRLQEILEAFMRAHPEYDQVSYIGAAGEGRELARVENRDGHVVVAPQDALQARGGADYFKAGLTLTAGRVYLSELAADPEQGNTPGSRRLVLRAATTVFDASGRVFGMMVIDKDVHSLFASTSDGLPPEVHSYAADQYGHYLFRSDAMRQVASGIGGKDDIGVDFPQIKPMFEQQTRQNDLSAQAVIDGKGGYLAAVRVYFDAGDPSRYLLLLCHLPASAAAQGFQGVLQPDLMDTMLVVLAVGFVFMLILRRTFSPLSRITVAAREIAAGNRHVRLKEAGTGEIGKLARALNIMLDKLSDGDQIKKESVFRKELIEALPGVFYMIDAQGRFLLWNHNLERVLQRGPEEMAASHPLDFFAGEDTVTIEHAIRQVFATGEATAEAEMISKDGTKTPFHLTGRRVERDGAPVLVGLGLDITQQRENLREAKAQLRRNQALMRNSMEGIHVLDVDGNVLEANDAFCSMLGYTRDEVLRLNVCDWDVKFSLADELRARIRSFIGKSDIFDAMHRRKDGSVIDVEICVNGVVIDDKVYLFASSRDITERKKLQAVQQRYQQVIEAAMDGFWMINTDGVVEEVNEAYARMSGYTMQELVGMHISQLDVKAGAAEIMAHVGKLMAQGHGRFETQHRRKDGQVFDVEVSAAYLPQAEKIFVFSHNITLRKQAEQALRVAAATFEMHEAILITDAQANIIRVNSAFTDITGYSPEDVLGRNPRIMSSGRHDKAFFAVLWEQLLDTGSWAGEIWDKRKNGEIYPKWMTITAVKNQGGETTQYVAIFSDITERKLAEEEIRNLAFYDALTQLANRRLFFERFQNALAGSARYGEYGAILFVDLDRFKSLNDTLGHDFGDLLLVEVAARIKSCVREVDTVSRFGGDEFVVLLENVGGDRLDVSRKAGGVAEKIREALSQPYHLKGQECHSSPSIGISVYHGNEASMEALIRQADAAMYQAKETGRNTVRFYDGQMQQDWESVRGLRPLVMPD